MTLPIIHRIHVPLMFSLLLVGVASAPAVADELPSLPSPDTAIPAGVYSLDKYHSTITFKVSHMGFSFYTGSFSRFEATLEFDPASLGNAVLTATIESPSLRLPPAPDGFREDLLGPQWLNANVHPKMSYQSTRVTPTGNNTARVTGDFTLNGTTAPVTFEVTFNGGYPGLPGLDPNARVGFSAQGILSRSDFNISAGIPPEGSNFGVGDRVEFIIEAEFIGPPLIEPTSRY